MSKEVGGMVGSRRVQGAGSARTEGARRASGVGADGAAVGAGALAPGQRWSASRKRDVVLRLLRGESLDTVSREVGVELYRLEAWQARALAGLELGLPVAAIVDIVSAFRKMSTKPTMKPKATRFDGTPTRSPVLGLRPLCDSRRRRRKPPKPRSSTFSPRRSDSAMVPNTVSTMTSARFFVRSPTSATSSTSPAFVSVPPVTG